MKIDTLPNLVRDSRRFHEIVSTLVKYGLAPWLSGIKANWIQRHFESSDGQRLSELTQGARLATGTNRVGDNLHQTWSDSQYAARFGGA